MLLILLVTSYVTTFLSFFIYCLPYHLLYLDMCDVTTYVTPTVGSLIIFLVIIWVLEDLTHIIIRHAAAFIDNVRSRSRGDWGCTTSWALRTCSCACSVRAFSSVLSLRPRLQSSSSPTSSWETTAKRCCKRCVCAVACELRRSTMNQTSLQMAHASMQPSVCACMCYSCAFCGRVCVHARVVYVCCVLHVVRVCAWVGSDGVSVLACVHVWPHVSCTCVACCVVINNSI